MKSLTTESIVIPVDVDVLPPVELDRMTEFLSRFTRQTNVGTDIANVVAIPVIILMLSLLVILAVHGFRHAHTDKVGDGASAVGDGLRVIILGIQQTWNTSRGYRIWLVLHSIVTVIGFAALLIIPRIVDAGLERLDASQQQRYELMGQRWDAERDRVTQILADDGIEVVLLPLVHPIPQWRSYSMIEDFVIEAPDGNDHPRQICQILTVADDWVITCPHPNEADVIARISGE